MLAREKKKNVPVHDCRGWSHDQADKVALPAALLCLCELCPASVGKELRASVRVQLHSRVDWGCTAVLFL